MSDDKKKREGPFWSFNSRKLFCTRQRQSWAPGKDTEQEHTMIVTKKVIESAESNPCEKTTRSVMTKTVEKTGGVRTITKTFQNCTEDGIDVALKQLDIDPKKFHSGGTSVTKTITYTDSSGKREVIEEVVETYGDPDKIAKEAGEKVDIKDCKKNAKTDAKKMGSSKDPSPQVKIGKNDAKEMGSSLGKVPSSAEPSNIDKKGSAGTAKLGQFAKDCLKAHNEYRAKHGVPALVLSKEICDYSQEWADHLAATDTFQHRMKDRKYGENIYMKWSSNPNYMVTGKDPVDSWYSEIKDHVFGREPTSLKSGHFTQVIWKESKQVGCAFARSKSGKILVVANYDPAGNFMGKFAQNVPSPKH